MKFEDRWYQIECADAMVKDVLDGHNPVCAIPTGAGKSVIICRIIDGYLSQKPEKSVLIISHVQKILTQNYKKIRQYFNGFPIGFYSAGVGRSSVEKITVAGIQSIYKKADLFKDVGLIIVDECHLINNEDVGMYRKLIKALPGAKISGLTATPYRTGQGYIYEGRNSIFDKLSYDLTSTENFNRLVEEGYLTQLISLPTEEKMDTEGIKILAGDFKEDELSHKFDRDEITDGIVRESIKKAGKKHKMWMAFAIDKNHCIHMRDKFMHHGIPAAAVYSGMKDDFDEIIDGYVKGKYKVLVSVNMLTTGVDIPEIDMIIHARPTQSPVIHVQTNGRGLRVAPKKTHCLVLDFAGNVDRLGPINDVYVKKPGDKKGSGGIMAKSCKNCSALNHLRAKECIACGEEFEIQEKITMRASSSSIVSDGKNADEWHEVRDVFYSVEVKKGAPSYLRVDYICGIKSFHECVLINHSGWAKAKAMALVRNRYAGDGNIPTNLKDLVAAKDFLKHPKRILVSKNGKYNEIKKVELHEGLPIKQDTMWDDDIPF